MADTIFGHETERHTHRIESFEVHYWADRFGVSADQVLEILQESEQSNLDDSLFENRI